MVGANPIALNLSEASHRISNGSTGGLGAVHKRTGLVPFNTNWLATKPPPVTPY
jgi:hypothetical protein